MAMRDQFIHRRRTLLVEVLALLSLLARECSMESEAVSERLAPLRRLLGAAHLHEFIARSEEFLHKITAQGAPLTHYLSNSLSKVLEELRDVSESGEFDEEFIDAVGYEVESEDFITETEILRVSDGFASEVELIESLMARLEEVGTEELLERLGGRYDLEALLRKISELDFTMGDLRMLNLALDLHVEHEICS